MDTVVYAFLFCQLIYGLYLVLPELPDFIRYLLGKD